MRKLALLTAVMLLAPAISQAKSLEELLMEKGVITKSEARGSMESGAAKVYWNDGTRLDFADTGFTAKINTLIQTRYTFTDNDNNVDNTSSFDVHLARLIVSGTALHEEFSYELEATLGKTGESGSSLDNAYIAWHACDWATVKMGQFKTGISRQFNTPDQNLMFADRSGTSDAFSLGRSQGASVTGDLADGKLRLGAAIFNGESTGEGRNSTGVDTKHTAVLSARWNAMGEMNSYSEGDVEWTEDAAASVGAAYAFAKANNTNVATADYDRDVLSVDANLKYQGLGINGEFFWQSLDVDGSDDTVEPVGFYVQAGYFLEPKKFELAARYGYVDCDNGNAGGLCTDTDHVDEVTVGLNYYWWAHHLKAQLNYSLLSENPIDPNGSDTNTNRWLLQLSSYF